MKDSFIWFVVGFVVAVSVCSGVEATTFKNRVSAGVFEEDGVSYRILRVQP